MSTVFCVARVSPVITLGFLPSSRIIWLRCQSASLGWEALESVHVDGTTLQETVLFEIFDIAPVELCGMDLRRPLARRQISEVFSMIVSLTAQTTAGLGFSAQPAVGVASYELPCAVRKNNEVKLDGFLATRTVKVILI
jgi:hypothetical protein